MLNRENLIHISKAIQNFLEKIIIKDNDLIQKISNIIKDSKEKKGIDIIKSCKEKLKELNFLLKIDVDKDDPDYIDLLISLNEQPESIIFLLKLTPEETQNLQELAMENDDSYIGVKEKEKKEKEEKAEREKKEKEEKEEKENIKEIKKEKKDQIIKADDQEGGIKIKEEKLKINPINLKGKKEEIEMEKIKILFNLIIQECSYLKEIASKSENSLISINEVLDMEKCVEYFIDLGNLDDLKFKEKISKSEYENILIQFNKFIINYGRIKALQSSLVENFIKKAKEFTENGFSILLKNQNNEKSTDEKDNKNTVNNFFNNANEIISFDKNAPSLKLFLEEEKEFFNKMNNYFQKIDNDLKNKEAILEKKNEELKIGFRKRKRN